MVKKQTRQKHFDLYNTLTSIKPNDESNIKGAIWLARAIKSVENTINIKLMAELEQKINTSKYMAEINIIRKNLLEKYADKDENGKPIAEDVKGADGNVVGSQYKLSNESQLQYVKEFDLAIVEKLETSEEFKILKTKHEENLKALDEYYKEEIEIEYPEIDQEAYEIAFKVELNQIFILEDLIK